MVEVFTPEEISRNYKVEVATIREWCRSKKLKAFKVGRQWRIYRADWEAFLASQGGESPKANGLALAY